MRQNRRAIRLRVGRNVRQLRRLHGWSQEQLAERVGNTHKHIGQVERGEVNVGIDILIAIAEGFEVNVADLFAGAPGDATGARALALTAEEVSAVEASLRVLRRVRQAAARRASPD